MPTPDLLRRHDVSGPRYTSYPTADRFVDAFGEADYVAALRLARRAGPRAVRPLSVYVHIPYCEQLCHYCACNKIVTRHKSRGAEYLQLLKAELALHVRHLADAAGPVRPRVSQLHLGGGTPTFLSDAELAELMDALKTHFELVPGGEYAIEIDPRTVTRERLAHLAQLGFNRLSFGVQDFDPAVQQAVHRVQPAEQVLALTADARELGFDAINADLIYGLPKQTPASFARTLEQLGQMRPDRVALYAYAHLPQRFKPQRRIADGDLPSPADKLQMLANAIAQLGELGYEHVGMDHFALPGDALAVAKRQGRMQRNFQGYSTQPDSDLIALGVSAIGRVGATYSQNAKTLEAYADAIARGHLPVVRGLALTREDLLRRAVIMAVMCQGELDIEALETSHGVRFASHFDAELRRLQPLVAEGLVTLDARALRVTPLGWYFVRAIAMVFDKHLQTDLDRARFSRII
ncbi:oxygen-independent coproporphyrinogen III oxidase [Comamonas serinivorans]|uniref:Coproporphyrinogen-III oxidase n=2 Tax=Comamonas serinivorans TaxID=1082851 RepID=A0A1Y0EQV1_9BURK|nr:oxygen-independent coproporphyrinogen III oxidase [Comamonas serinivorans]